MNSGDDTIVYEAVIHTKISHEMFKRIYDFAKQRRVSFSQATRELIESGLFAIEGKPIDERLIAR